MKESEIGALFTAETDEEWQMILMEMESETLEQIQSRCDAVADFVDAELDFRETTEL